MTSTVIGVFQNRTDVEQAIDQLKSKGFNPKDVSIVMRDTKEAADIGDDTGANVAGGAVTGITTGAVIGGLAGLLASFVIPGLGAFFIGGPIAAALGLTGVAASTASGAATGAVAGGLLGALTGFGLTDDEARYYESRVKEGAILVAVPADDVEISYVTGTFDEWNATDVKTIETPSEVRSTATTRKYADREPAASSRSYGSSHQFAGAKGGQSKGRGWRGDRKHHAKARKGEEPHSGRK